MYEVISVCLTCSNHSCCAVLTNRVEGCAISNILIDFCGEKYSNRCKKRLRRSVAEFTVRLRKEEECCEVHEGVTEKCYSEYGWGIGVYVNEGAYLGNSACQRGPRMRARKEQWQSPGHQPLLVVDSSLDPSPRCPCNKPDAWWKNC